MSDCRIWYGTPFLLFHKHCRQDKTESLFITFSLCCFCFHKVFILTHSCQFANFFLFVVGGMYHIHIAISTLPPSNTFKIQKLVIQKLTSDGHKIHLRQWYIFKTSGRRTAQTSEWDNPCPLPSKYHHGHN